jgi:hypothetical protein
VTFGGSGCSTMTAPVSAFATTMKRPCPLPLAVALLHQRCSGGQACLMVSRLPAAARRGSLSRMP